MTARRQGEVESRSGSGGFGPSEFLLAFLKKGGPISLNSLMIVNTKLTWNEDCDGGHPSCSYGAPVYGYSLGFGQVRQFQCPAHREAACGCGFPLTSLHAAHTA